jgi:hypothetical protein
LGQRRKGMVFGDCWRCWGVAIAFGFGVDIDV